MSTEPGDHQSAPGTSSVSRKTTARDLGALDTADKCEAQTGGRQHRRDVWRRRGTRPTGPDAIRRLDRPDVGRHGYQMFPIRDHNPSLATPWVTYALIAANVAVFLAMLGLGSDPRAMQAVYVDYALIPALSDPASFVTSQFLHGGVLHLGGNMLFLWVFGDNLEDEMGALPFLGFYLGGGVAAGLAQVLADPASTVPMVGASGAIAAVMGGYLLLFPRARVDVLVIFIVFFRVFPIPAWIVLGAWFGIQLVSGANTPTEGGGVAYWAHAGGFAAGLALTAPLFVRRGGPAYWRRTDGHPPHPQAHYARQLTAVPRAGRRR